MADGDGLLGGVRREVEASDRGLGRPLGEEDVLVAGVLPRARYGLSRTILASWLRVRTMTAGGTAPAAAMAAARSLATVAALSVVVSTRLPLWM